MSLSLFTNSSSVNACVCLSLGLQQIAWSLEQQFHPRFLITYIYICFITILVILSSTTIKWEQITISNEKKMNDSGTENNAL